MPQATSRYVLAKKSIVMKARTMWTGMLQDDRNGDLVDRIVPTLRKICRFAAGLMPVSPSIVLPLGPIELN
jgi:hypothetical protein